MKRLIGKQRARQIRLARERGRRNLLRKRVREARARLIASALFQDDLFGRRSHTLRAFSNVGRDLPIRLRGESAVITSPSTFSFIEDPQGALDTAVRFAAAIRSNQISIFFDQSASRSIDLCALTVMEAIALEADSIRNLDFSGAYPTDTGLREIVDATGLPQALKVSGPTASHFRVLDLISAIDRGTRGRRSSPPELYASQITEYFRECFADFNYRLNSDAQRLLASGLGEMLGNAEEHSHGGPWYAKAYLRRPTGRDYGDCHLVVFNLGPTIADTLGQLDAKAPVRTTIEQIVRKHRGPSLSRRFHDEEIWTVLALQEGVSNKKPDWVGIGSHRGTGTVEIIEMFQDLGRTVSDHERPMMAILSGRTHILFDGRYRMADVLSPNGDLWQRIAFNKANDIWLPPDKEVVRRLKRPFPGTLISMRFYLDPKYLAASGDQYGSSH